MSKRMNNERAIEILTDLYNHELIIFKNNADEPSESDYTNIDVKQALDIAIKSLETRYQMNDKGEITPIDNEWHTEQPQEDRQYLVTYYQECDLLIMCKWKNKQWYDTKGIALDNDRVVAWKKVEPYERKE